MNIRILLIWTLLFLSFTIQAQNKELENIIVFTKIWGFLKYHHPNVATGNINWDKEFIQRVDVISKINESQKRDEYYTEWINGLGKIKKKKTALIKKDTFNRNYDITWLGDDKILGKRLSKKLKYIYKYRNISNNYYVSQNENTSNAEFLSEEPYKDSIFPSFQLRLLGLARYWNIINYYYPYKYVTTQNWNDVLTEMLPKFQLCKDTLSYHLAMAELVAKLNDSHANLRTDYLKNNFYGQKRPAFLFKIIDNKIVVKNIFQDSLCKIDDIKIGDVILKINGKKVEELIEKYKPFIGASNYAILLRNLTNVLMNSNSDESLIECERNNIITNKNIHLFNFQNFRPNNDPRYSTWEILNDSIGYINLGTLTKDRTNNILQKLKNLDAIIFDARNYPQGTMYEIGKFLNKEKKEFVKFIAPVFNNPSLFAFDDVYSCGENNPDYFKGLVVILMDERTQSHAEFTIMSLQTAPKVLLIGSQTAGADGNVSSIVLPGNYKSYMTGLGVFYPSGKETQRIGIIPDIEVKPTIQGIKEGRDEVLERAIEEVKKRRNN